MGIKVFSAFDGSACAYVALDRLGFKVDRYVASEIDKYAMTVAANNFLDIEHVGDITKVDGHLYKGFDLLVGGSPCQGFSFAGKQLNFEDPRSKLFFEFVRLRNEMQPKYFFLENVVMKKEFQDVISSYLGVEPVMLNSSLVSAQSRKRLYWTNIPGYTAPEDKGILLKDIVHEHTDFERLKGRQAEWFAENAEFQLKKKYSSLDAEKAITMTARQYASWNGNYMFERLNEFIVPFDKTLQILDKEVARGKVGYFRKDSQANRVYYIHDKAVTLCGDAGGGAAKMGQYLFGEVKREVHQCIRPFEGDKTVQMQNRVYNIDGIAPTLRTRCDQTHISVPLRILPEDYLFGCITPDRVDQRQNGQRFNDGTKFYTLTAQDRHGILIEGYMRKLTPIECERLQTLPDNYTLGVSNSQRYKMLGNGWTVDAVCEFFKHIPKYLDLF